MTSKDWFLFASTFVVGMATGMFLYTTSFKPLYDPDTVAGTEEDAAEFSVVGRSYGGMTLPDYVHPSFRIYEGGRYSYFAGGTGVGIDEEPVEGRLPGALWEDLDGALRTRDLATLSRPVIKDNCRTFIDAPDYIYLVTIEGEQYELDTCATDIEYEDPLLATFNEVWSYLREPTSYEGTSDTNRDAQGFLTEFLRSRLDVDYEEGSEKPDDGTPTACTAEAKICPDGTAVGRTGSNCEFAACPGE